MLYIALYLLEECVAILACSHAHAHAHDGRYSLSPQVSIDPI